MNRSDSITLSQDDYNRLSNLIENLNSGADLLEDELARAAVVSKSELPADIVCMNSTVRFVDLESDKESEVTLVYPENADLEKNKISILAPVGSALIGLRVGEIIDWPLPGGKTCKLRVLDVKR